jgi:CrcB protein
MLFSIAAVAIGGGLGALARWLLSTGFNTVLPDLPLGTLIANLSAGYIIGLSMVLFAHYSGVSRDWQLFVNTGLMGGLSTFSTFSWEVTERFIGRRWPWAFVEIGAHVGGSLAMTALGIATASIFFAGRR